MEAVSEKLDFMQKKAHAIKLKNVKARLKKLKIHNYSKEFKNIDNKMLYRVMNNTAYSLEILNSMEVRLDEIERLLAEIK